MILWSDLKVKWRDLNFCVVSNECFPIHVCISWMFLLKESMVAPFFAMFIALMTFSIFGWVRISIVEAGAITSILFSSWPGADHEILCCNLLSPLFSRPGPRHHMFAGPRVRWALLQNFTSLSLLIMIEREGRPRYCFDWAWSPRPFAGRARSVISKPRYHYNTITIFWINYTH